MKNQWVQRSSGYMTIRVTGVSTELFLNQCAKRNIVIWEIKYEEEEKFIANVLLADLSKLKKMAKHLPCKIFFIEKKGIPFLVSKLNQRKGMVAGVIGFLLFLVTLSNMVWGIEIDGASPALEHKMHETISELGIQKGKFQYFLPSPEEIQQEIMNEMDEVTWVGVTKQGASYQFQVVEKEIVEEAPPTISGHLVASRKAVIHDMFVEKGKAMVKTNQVVEKGDILVSGLIGKEDDQRIIAAKGSVTGEFWYGVKVKVPLHLMAESLTGNINRKHGIGIGEVTIPIWGWRGLDAEETVKETFSIKWKPFGVTMPFNYKFTDEYELKSLDKERIKDEALAIASEESKKELLGKFSDKAEVVDEKVLHQMVDGGKVKISLHFRIMDEIAVKQPIIQGD
ncbi:sporulation protein YqfD [Salipaludibacillus daqingensis]|uniref:sporulation protein YqfD n=1 Tax=Salipaludibacillus daqingensis TaxID=3041001 RepID=UPI0024736D15|nr:sporulation protein YqfD [Salipaludibacillus daqingensis]